MKAALTAAAGLTLLLLTGAASGAESPARPEPVERHGFNVRDLVMLERASDPHLSPDERYVAYQLRETDLPANKGVHGIWLIDLADKNAVPRRLTAAGVESNTPRWAADGRLYFLSSRSGSQQLWRLDLAGGEAQQVTRLPLDVTAFRVAPDARRLALSLDVFASCPDLECTKKKLDDARESKAKGMVFDRLFIRHWDTWKNGTRAQLFGAELDARGAVSTAPRLLSVGIDGDVPTKPFGGDEDFVFTPDGGSVIFVARIAGQTEAWSTNTDLWRVPFDASSAPQNLSAPNPGYDTGPAVSPDGKTLAWRSMQRGGFEADRLRILVKDLSGGAPREVAAGWDRSADAIAWSHDGRTLLVLAEDLGQRRVFAVEVKSGKVKALTDTGSVEGFDAGAHELVYTQNTLGSTAQVFAMNVKGGKPRQLSRHNDARLAATALGEYEQFTFAGWNDEKVYGYAVKPATFAAGRKYPVAFIIHGGPQGSMGNHWHYRWNPQTYAGAGYAVIAIDFHGSTGYGQAFTDSISGDWGGKPLVDLQKGLAAALARYDWLDGSRVCALGASYGGFMVNWIAGNWSEPFKCLVSHDGVFDNRAMGYGTEELWFTEWDNGGTVSEHPENYEKFNPVNHVAKWKLPMLVVQGGLDYRIPDNQGIAAFTALQRRGVESRFLYFPNENHWVLKPQNSIQWHDTVLDWMNRHVGG
jgi:dipeptidyl aminopeptidase/acylaminoacyl peptidase